MKSPKKPARPTRAAHASRPVRPSRPARPARPAQPARSTRKARTARHAPTKYKVGQEIVYPLQGVGHISAIEERPFRERRILYYIVYLEVTDMTIMVPVDKADDLGIRAIVGKKESQKALRLIAEEYEPIVADWKLRYQMNLDLLKKGSIIDIANVVRALYHRSRIKELPILERKLYDSALKLLIDEVSFSLLKSKDDVEELVFARLKANVK
jgi:CarD family transcriptional regulator